MAYTDDLLKQFLTLSGSTAKQSGANANSAFGDATNFFKSLTGRTTDASAAGTPEGESIRGQADLAKKELAEKGTGRTGGTAAAGQDIEAEVRKQISSLLAQMRTNGANSLANIGQSELNAMLQALGIGTNAAQQDVESRRAASAQLWSSLIGGAGKLASAFIPVH